MQAKIAFSSVISVKTGINYPDLEPGNEFWNRVRVPGSCYKSLPVNDPLQDRHKFRVRFQVRTLIIAIY